jgi:hypothetical protein
MHHRAAGAVTILLPAELFVAGVAARRTDRTVERSSAGLRAVEDTLQLVLDLA